MHRIYDSAGNPHDFCILCFPTEADAVQRFADIGDGPDGRGNCFDYNCEAPPVDLSDGYECDHCGRPVTN